MQICWVFAVSGGVSRARQEKTSAGGNVTNMFQTIWIDIKYCFRGNLDIALNVAEKNLRDKQITTVRFVNSFFTFRLETQKAAEHFVHVGKINMNENFFFIKNVLAAVTLEMSLFYK